MAETRLLTCNDRRGKIDVAISLSQIFAGGSLPVAKEILTLPISECRFPITYSIVDLYKAEAGFALNRQLASGNRKWPPAPVNLTILSSHPDCCSTANL